MFLKLRQLPELILESSILGFVVCGFPNVQDPFQLFSDIAQHYIRFLDMPVVSLQNMGCPNKQVFEGLEEREWTEVEPLGMDQLKILLTSKTKLVVCGQRSSNLQLQKFGASAKRGS